MGELDALANIVDILGKFNKRKQKAREGQISAAESAIVAQPILPPRSPEVSFPVPGIATFGLPATFQYLNPGAYNWGRARPLVVVGEGEMWLAVMQDEGLMAELDPGFSPWTIVIQSDTFRKSTQKWGGTVVAGPTAVLLDGEKATWSAFRMMEDGKEARKWGLLAMHDGHTYELLANISLQNERSNAEAFWTAVGSWRWA